MSWLLRVVTGAGWCLGRDAPVVPRENLRKIRKSNSGSPVIPFPFYHVSLILSLSLLHSSFAPVLSLLLTYPLFFTFLRYANCLERVTSSTNCASGKWIWFVSLVNILGVFLTSPICRLTRSCVEFYSISFFLFLPFFFICFVFPFFRTTRSIAFGTLIWRDQRSFFSSRRWHLHLVLRTCAISSRLFFLPVLPVSRPRKYDAHHFES